MKKRIHFRIAAGSEQGSRETQDDAFFYAINKKNQAMAIVCDGIGSEPGSSNASQIACQVAKDLFDERKNIWFPDSFSATILSDAHTAINEFSSQRKQPKNIGTTFVSVIIKKNVVHCTNIGDSRLYYYCHEKNTWEQITRDQNLLNYIIMKTEKEKKQSPSMTPQIEANREKMIAENADNLLALTKSLQSGDNTEYLDADHYTFSVKNKDILLLCSDGVYNFIEPHHVNTLINENQTESEFQCVPAQLIKDALDGGSNDNLTAIVIKITEKDE